MASTFSFDPVEKAKWANELLPLDIKFEAKKAIKSQAIADFLTEWIEQQQPTEVHSEHWTMFFDGSKMLNGSGAGVVLVSPRGDKLRYVLQIHFDSSNNEAEYEALLYGLRMAISRLSLQTGICYSPMEAPLSSLRPQIATIPLFL